MNRLRHAIAGRAARPSAPGPLAAGRARFPSPGPLAATRMANAGFAGFAGFLAALALLQSACFDDRVAGNGSEVENAVVLGRVYLPSGEPAAGVRMQLLPDDYDPRKGGSAEAPRTAVTQADGTFRLSSRAGSFNVYASHESLGYKLLISDVVLAEEEVLDAGRRRMADPGSIRLALPERAKAGDYVYLAGLPLAQAVDSAAHADGYLQVDSVPAGRIGKVVLASAADTSGLGADVAVAPRRVTELLYTEWRHHGTVAIRTEAVPGGLSADVHGIPLLLRLSKAGFDFRQAAPGGADLRFTRDDGRPLPFHIQDWDTAAALVWVRMDTLSADSAAQKIRMYWGAPDTAKPLPDGAGQVFAGADGYVGAWHLDAVPQGTPPHFQDAGSRGTRALALGTLASAGTGSVGDTGVGVDATHGLLGPGVHLDGRAAYIQADDTVAASPAFTLSFLFRTTTDKGGKLAGFAAAGDTLEDRVIWMDDAGLLHFRFHQAPERAGGTGLWQTFVSKRTYNDGQWHHLSSAFADGSFRLYVDGEEVVGYAGATRSLAGRGTWRFGWVGGARWESGWTSPWFQGSLDEIRLLDAARPADWLKVDQATVDPGVRLLVLERR